MLQIFDIFIEKILIILITIDGANDEGKRIIELALEVFDSFIV